MKRPSYDLTRARFLSTETCKTIIRRFL